MALLEVKNLKKSFKTGEKALRGIDLSVEKQEIVEDAEVICHRCWLDLREKTFKQLKRDSNKWIEEPLPNSQRIKSFLTRWEEFEFGTNMPDDDLNKTITELKDSIRRSARGE